MALQWPCTKPGPGKTSGILPIYFPCHLSWPQCSVTQTWSSTLELCRKTVPKLRKEEARKGPGLFFCWTYYRTPSLFLSFGTLVWCLRKPPIKCSSGSEFSAWLDPSNIRTRLDLCILESRSGSSQGKKSPSNSQPSIRINWSEHWYGKQDGCRSRAQLPRGFLSHQTDIYRPPLGDLTSLWLY